ncbi:hypothetical protein MMC07_003814 [Pseudocyphellaria aurata]|nr:hypothetical protein [Pseudocyphellaria aurata]
MKERQKDFKWFGEGFDGFPKRLPDDCVEYTVHVIDSALAESTGRTQLRQVQQAANVLTKRLLKDFIWQRQSFKLELVEEKGFSFLRGRTNYGDSVEDEWLIVFILRELSYMFSDAWIRIIDTDGEFLLIEAANVLPPWLNPEVADFRVSFALGQGIRSNEAHADNLQLWLNEGKLLVLPLHEPPEKLAEKNVSARTITLHGALRFIQDNRRKLMHSTLIEAEAFYRLHKYPKQIEDNHHHTVATIPRNLAFILHENAAFISPAVEAFYLRDPIALRPLQTHDVKLVFPPKDLVTVSIKFTKVGYAQIKSQQFPAPAVWKSQFSTAMDPKLQSRTDLGMKVTCGFEMLLSDPQHIDTRSVREIQILMEDLESEQARLPSDAEISSWGAREDDESWLDIDFEDFEAELAGKAGKSQSHTSHGFGDKTAQENLRNMVKRFEDFLNDDKAGPEGAEFFDDMDNDNDETADGANSAGEESDSDSEDKDVSFDEDQFAGMMREMMGMPADTATGVDRDPRANQDVDEMHGTVSKVRSIDDEEDFDIRRAMHEMQVELEDAGALHHASQQAPDTATRPPPQNSEAERRGSSTVTAHERDTDEDVEIDYNLAKNLLESFKIQHGAAGPGGNLMGLMGMRLPRDQDNGPDLES